jgi:hypothetical protein
MYVCKYLREIPASKCYYCQILIEHFLDKVFVKKKDTQKSNSIEISPVGAELFHADIKTDGQTHMTKWRVRFS